MGQRGEKVAQYIRKGGKVTVTGELKSREHNGKTYFVVEVNDVTLQSKPDAQGGNQGGGYDSGSQGGGYGNQGGAPSRDLEDEIPF